MGETVVVTTQRASEASAETVVLNTRSASEASEETVVRRTPPTHRRVGEGVGGLTRGWLGERVNATSADRKGGFRGERKRNANLGGLPDTRGKIRGFAAKLGGSADTRGKNSKNPRRRRETRRLGGH